MKRYILIAAVLLCTIVSAVAQTKTPAKPVKSTGTSNSIVRRDATGARTDKDDAPGGVTRRMQSHFEKTPTSDADLSWMRVIYRQLDLTKDRNTPLYFPDEPIDGQENLFRIIMRLLAAGQLDAYEYLDGREIFSDDYRIKVRDMLDRFHVLYTPAKGSSDKNPRFTIDDSDVPASEVLSYYIIERWEFDNRSNRMRTVVEAICPVLHRSGDFGGEAVRYPMFWVRMDDLRPFLTTQTIFTSDDNNLATCTYDDYFQLGLYDGEIYKTRNLRNQSLMQLHPDPEDMARARDSIENRLKSFGDKLWVADPVDTAAAAKNAKTKKKKTEVAATAEESATPGEEGDAASTEAVEPAAEKTPAKASARTKRGAKKPSVKKPKAAKPAANSAATKSVRNRKK